MPDFTLGRDAITLCGQALNARELGRAAEARRLFEQAMLAEPRHFQANFNLALMDLEAGKLEAAQRRTEQSLAWHGPSNAMAWLSARVALARGDFTSALTRLEPLLAATVQTPDQQAETLLLASDAFDGLGRFDEAFAAAAKGKAVQRAAHAQRAASREGEVEKLSRLAAWFESADPAPWQTPAPASAPIESEPDTHVFLVGFPRSGTTLLEQVLAGHPEVSALEEAPTLARAYAEFMTCAEDLERLAHLSAEDAAGLRDIYWGTARQFHAGPLTRVFVDKAPAGTLSLPLIAKPFPRAKILFALRDPRGVTLSCFRHDFQLNAMTYTFTDLGRTAACYDACMRMATAYRSVLPLDLIEVRHEALVEDFDAQLQVITSHLGLTTTEAMGDVAATAARRNIRTPSARQVRAGLNTSGLDNWRAYAAHLRPVLPTLAPWVARFGYPAD